MERRLIEHLASLVQARLNCITAGNHEWLARHTERLEQIERDLLPSGSGIDSGTKVDLNASTGEKVVLRTSFHHMNDAGMYDRWTEHTVIIRPSFTGFSLTVSGRNHNDIKDYLAEVFNNALRTKYLDEQVEEV